MHTQTSYTSAFLLSLIMLPAFQLQAGDGSSWTTKKVAGLATVVGVVCGAIGATSTYGWNLYQNKQASEKESKCKKQEDANAIKRAQDFLQTITINEAHTSLINRIYASNDALYRVQTFFHLIEQHIVALEHAEARENCNDACQDTNTQLRLFLQQAREDKAVYNAQIKEKEERVRLETIQAKRDIALAVSERERIWAAEAAQQKERADSAHTHTISLLTTANAEFAKLDETTKKGFEKINDRLAEQTEQFRIHNSWQTKRSVQEQQLISELSRLSPLINILNDLPNSMQKMLETNIRTIIEQTFAQQAHTAHPEYEQSDIPPFNPGYVAKGSAPEMEK